MKGFIEVTVSSSPVLVSVSAISDVWPRELGGGTDIYTRSGEGAYIHATESYEEVKEKLRIALYDHITVREVREFCKSHIQENGDTDCSDCPFLEGNPEGKGESWQPYSCGFWNMSPSDWCGGDIARKIKEASND